MGGERRANLAGGQGRRSADGQPGRGGAERDCGHTRGAGQNGYGLRIWLAKFHSRMGPVREDRNVDNALAVVLQVWLAQDSPELTLRIRNCQ